MSRKGEKPKPVSVYVRCRPRNDTEKAAGSHSIIECTKKEVILKQCNSNLNKKYTFDHVYGPRSTQVDLYKGVAASTVEEVLQGYNCTIFAYGQTGTGKTYTMEGSRSIGSNIPWEKDPNIGLIPRTMSHLFDRLNSQASDFSVRVSMLELYNEELFDLLSPNESNQKLRLFEDSTRKVTRGIGSVVIQGLEEVQVMSKDEVYGLMERAMQKRQTAATLLNAASSRSHVVFTVTVHIKTVSQDDINDCEEEIFKMGKLNLVDLAGSENIGRSGAQNARAREAGNINQSLLTLGRVITALVDRAPHVPYRESKLTRLLQDSLGGRTQTSIIATISPAFCNMEETISTLEYANRAKNILNKPEVNQRSSKKALIKEYTAEIEKLKKELQMSREKGGVYLEFDKFTEMEQRMKSQADIIKDKEEQLASLVAIRTKVDNLFTDSIKQIDGLHQKIDRKEQVESQNRLIINNYVQNNQNNYSMFRQFVVQRKEALTSNYHDITNLLQQSKQQESRATDQSHELLNKLMETVARGLTVTSEKRDEAHGRWLEKYVNQELLPLIQQHIQKTVELKQFSDDRNQRMLESIRQYYDVNCKKLDLMKQSTEYMMQSCNKEGEKLLTEMKARRKYLDEIVADHQNMVTETCASAQRAFESAMSALKSSSMNRISQAAESLKQSNVLVEGGAEGIISSVNHWGTSVIDGYSNPLLEEMNSQVQELASTAASNKASASKRICELGESYEDIGERVKRIRTSYDCHVASTCEEVQASHTSLTTGNGVEESHLKDILEARGQCDVAAIQARNHSQNSLGKVFEGVSQLSNSASEMCNNCTTLINEQSTAIQELADRVTEDLPTGTTPKRARLNKLKLHQNSNYQMDVIESDEENSDPNNKTLDMSY